MDPIEVAAQVALYIVPLWFALAFHECAHGYVAKLRGDNTAFMLGRLTMNPLSHIDPIGTVLLPILAIVFHAPFFGWAKPVPVNSRNLKNPRVDMFWIALAGPLSNIFLALVGAAAMFVAVHFLRGLSYFSAILNLLDVFISINLVLAIFNLIPVNPLDGGKVLARFLPAQVNYKLEQHQNVISIVLFIVFMSGAMRFFMWPAELGHLFLRSWALGML